MRWSLFTLAAVVGLATCHNAEPHSPQSRHVPQLLGARKFLSELRGRRQQETPSAPRLVRVPEKPTEFLEEPDEEIHNLDARQSNNKDGRCGARYSSCATGYCCSAEGWCGLGEDYCTSPDCQLNYGPGCDGNQKPSGVDTSTIARPKNGKIAYGGAGIYDCVNQGDIAVTFDDGPYNFTNDLLDKLKSYNAKATFFITGNNLGKGPINDPKYPWRAVIQRMAAEGHQIASHTWSHQNFSQLSTTQAQNQMVWNEIAFNDILGYFPTYMRPPFSICESACQKLLSTLGYHEIYFDLDTEGYLNDDPTLIQTSKDIWDETINDSNPCKQNFLQIEHDIHYQTVYNLTDYVLSSLFAHGYRSVTVGECLGDPPENWYRAGSGTVPSYTFPDRQPTGTYSCLKPTTSISTTRPGTSTTTTVSSTTKTTTTSPTSTLKVSTDGSCGNGVTCLGSQYGNCCSVNGFCGSSIDYCGNSCNSKFGTCAIPDPSISTSTKTSAAPAPTSTLVVSTDATCGGDITCEGSDFGNCCSEHGYCGSTADYCLIGCQPAFGLCGLDETTTSSPAPPTTTSSPPSTTPTSTVTTSTSRSTSFSTSTSTSRSTSTSKSTSTTRTSTTVSTPVPTALIPSPNGRCGVGTPYTCRGSSFGVCCNGLGTCGVLCLIGECQPAYGICIFGNATESDGQTAQFQA